MGPPANRLLLRKAATAAAAVPTALIQQAGWCQTRHASRHNTLHQSSCESHLCRPPDLPELLTLTLRLASRVLTASSCFQPMEVARGPCSRRAATRGEGSAQQWPAGRACKESRAPAPRHRRWLPRVEPQQHCLAGSCPFLPTTNPVPVRQTTNPVPAPQRLPRHAPAGSSGGRAAGAGP